jgi:hypothetical protein
VGNLILSSISVDEFDSPKATGILKRMKTIVIAGNSNRLGKV